VHFKSKFKAFAFVVNIEKTDTLATLFYYVSIWALQALFVGINDKDLKWIASDLVRLRYFMFCVLFLNRPPDIRDVLRRG